MKKFVFILGGVRSGKSSYAVNLAKKLKKRTVFIATAQAGDEEMKKRIKKHKSSRPRGWKLIEEAKDVSSVIERVNRREEVILIDCLGFLISNLLMTGLKDRGIRAELRKLVRAVIKLRQNVILVSNEVGCGVVPESVLGRRFRDLIGLANQWMAKAADEVIFMKAGIPVIIKPACGRQELKIKTKIKTN